MRIATHQDHFAQHSPEVCARLEAIQAEVERRVAGAERCISYAMPAFRKGRVFLYFAAFKRHIGLYPPVSGPAELIAELAPYLGPKGNLIFPHSEPLQLELIGRVIESLAARLAR